jgi:hypothetical protein
VQLRTLAESPWALSTETEAPEAPSFLHHKSKADHEWDQFVISLPRMSPAGSLRELSNR